MYRRIRKKLWSGISQPVLLFKQSARWRKRCNIEIVINEQWKRVTKKPFLHFELGFGCLKVFLSPYVIKMGGWFKFGNFYLLVYLYRNTIIYVKKKEETITFLNTPLKYGIVGYGLGKDWKTYIKMQGISAKWGFRLISSCG